MKLKKYLISLNILIFTLILIIFLMAFNPLWYHLNYSLDNTHEKVDQQILTNETSNLILYFAYSKDLDENLWTGKEIKHMDDVRQIFAFLLLLIIISLVTILKYRKYIDLKKYKVVIYYVLGVFSLALIFFSFFWNKIFHTLLFRNDYWIMNPQDLSYYLFPETFFIRSLILILFVLLVQLILINYFTWRKSNFINKKKATKIDHER